MATHILHAMKEVMHFGSVFPEAKAGRISCFFRETGGEQSKKNGIEQEVRMQTIEEGMQRIKARVFLQQF